MDTASLPLTLAVLLPAAFAAGLVDAVVGGGGLILLPALFAAFPAALPATLLGTNKAVAIWGTLFSAQRYRQSLRARGQGPLPGIGVAAVLAMLASAAGAWAVSRTDPALLRQALPLVLLVLLLYVLRKKDLGSAAASLPARTPLLLCALALIIGFYDGYLGPGTGSFFVFALVRLVGQDFLHASAYAKLLNLATNLAALILFGLHGYIQWQWVAPLALANVLGSLLGTRLALRHGAGFVRKGFIVVVLALLLKTAYDHWLR